MNVLITVISLLMVMMLLSISQIRSYGVHSLLRNATQERLLQLESELSRKSAEQLYEAERSQSAPQKPSAGKSDEAQKEAQEPRSPLNRRFSLTALKDIEAKGGDDLQRRLFENLIRASCGQHRFYQQFLQSQAQQGRNEEDVLELLISTILNYMTEHRITHPNQLTRIPFNDPDYRNLFAKMLGGRDGLAYPDIRPYLTVAKRQQEISIYLAEKPMLLAIVGDPAEVKMLMELRTEIYNDLIHERIDAQEGQERLRAAIAPGPFDSLLTFRVSKTRPPK